MSDGATNARRRPICSYKALRRHRDLIDLLLHRGGRAKGVRARPMGVHRTQVPGNKKAKELLGILARK
jgi:hypothetical protein